MNYTTIRSWTFTALIGFLGFGLADGAYSQTQKIEPAGAALMYQAYCTACHEAKVHWREQKLATDWVSLVAQVRRWQSTTGLHWSEQDIDAVAKYLNDTYYHYPMPN